MHKRELTPAPTDHEQAENEQWEVLADSANGTGDALTALADAEHVAIIKPWPLRPAVPGGFTLDASTVVESAADQPGTVRCPNGITRPISATRTVTFGAACRGCTLRASCTPSARGRKLSLHPAGTVCPRYQALQRAHRARAQDPGFQAVYRRHRPMVEGSIAWLVASGNRRLRFRGTRPNDLPGST